MHTCESKPASDADERLYRRSMTTGSAEVEEEGGVSREEIEAAQQFELEVMRRHQTICSWLRIDCGEITPHHLRWSTLSDEIAVQHARLERLFGMCGVKAESSATVREDIIRTIASEEVNSNRQLEALYLLKATEMMAATSATAATSSSSLPQVTALHISNFVKLSRVRSELAERLDEARSSNGASGRELKMRVEVFPPDPIGRVIDHKV